MSEAPVTPIQKIYRRAHLAARHIMLSEGDDERVQAAAAAACTDKLARITLLGDPAGILPALAALGARDGAISVIDPRHAPDVPELADSLHRLRAHKGVTASQARTLVIDPVLQAALRVRLGQADGTIGGAVTPTADVVRAALQIIGPAAGISTVSSSFLMQSPSAEQQLRQGTIFSDCGLVVAPDAGELADIAMAAASTCRALLGEAPRIALLSFSTAGSAEHPRLNVVRTALAILRERDQTLEVDGEMQFDAALDAEVRARKAPHSRLSGAPNVYIFPDLASGNIGYKIAQRLGGLDAFGPILQGLALPANDLSRGCSIADIIAVIAITAVQATARPG